MSNTSTFVLGAGYLLAIPFSLWPPGFRRLWQQREPGVIAAELAGAALLALGWGMRGRPVAAIINAAWGIGLGVAYAIEGSRRARRTKAEGAAPP